MCVALTANAVLTEFASVKQVIEFPSSVVNILAPVGSGDCLKKLKVTYNIARVLGIPANIDEDLAGLVTGNPAKVVYLHLTVDTAPNGNTTGLTVLAKFRIHAKFFEPLLTGVSTTI